MSDKKIETCINVDNCNLTCGGIAKKNAFRVNCLECKLNCLVLGKYSCGVNRTNNDAVALCRIGGNRDYSGAIRHSEVLILDCITAGNLISDSCRHR